VAAYDLIIVGGGIGGSALAAVMAKAGRSVLLLEQSEAYQDRVRGEWIAPWGVDEVKRVGLYDLLMGAGGHHLHRHVTYDESLEPAAAEARTLPLGIFRDGVPGPLCIGHPHHCQTLFDAARAAGATVLRGVRVAELAAGAAPRVVYEHEGRSVEARGRLLVGADGRTSQVRETVGIALHQDQPHHWFGGLLIEGADGWPADLQAIGTEGDFGFLAFPQGGGRVRIYGGYPLDQAQRFRGPDGARRFLDAFAMSCSPQNRHLVAGRGAGGRRRWLERSDRRAGPLDHLSRRAHRERAPEEHGRLGEPVVRPLRRGAGRADAAAALRSQGAGGSGHGVRTAGPGAASQRA
jgi:menaquinone-9 beta-reductase